MTFRPEMTRSSTAMTAMNRRTWTRPPSVVPVNRPSSQRTIRITAMVYNIKMDGSDGDQVFSFFRSDAGSRVLCQSIRANALEDVVSAFDDMRRGDVIRSVVLL